MEVRSDPLFIQNSENDTENSQISEEERINNKMNSFKMNNYWNNKNEKLVSQLGEKANAYQWLHNKAASRFYTFDKSIGVSITILTAAISVESQIKDVSPKVDNFINILKFLAFVMSSVNIFLNYQEASEKHKQAGAKFQYLYNSIEEEVSQYKQLRTNAVEFIRDSNKLYTSLISESPTISTRELKAFKNTFKNNTAAKPTILDSLQKIVPVRSQNKAKETITNLYQTTKELDHIIQITDDITDEDIMNIKSEKMRFQTERFMNQI